MANTLTLSYLINGEPLLNAFKVNADETSDVSDLKDLIKAKMTVAFSDVDASQLTLWRVSIPDGSRRNGAGSLSLRLRKSSRRSISETRIFQTTADVSRSEDSQQRTIARTIFADKSSYIEALGKGAINCRYVFPRPRRFGKSAFLNMLRAYYDVHNAGIFDDLFGPLYIGKNQTTSKNKLLVLKFDLSSISVSGSVDEMKISFKDYINGILMQFLEKYHSELGYPEKGSIIGNSNASESLRQILIS
ncbi:hypothetical protein EDD21DRAFT_419848 [Dissophora ornata]|nr:hypothetical protein EDD21DRAFT_419848 [Dissophora ornata]